MLQRERENVRQGSGYLVSDWSTGSWEENKRVASTAFLPHLPAGAMVSLTAAFPSLPVLGQGKTRSKGVQPLFLCA
jgi:hypothetical protein